MNKQEYMNKQAQINSNPDLSQAGKRKQLDALQSYAREVEADTLRTLKAQWNVTRALFADHQERVQAAEEAEAARWDYNRLNYNEKAVKAAVANAASIYDVEAAYEKARASGDEHTRRAWAEFVAVNVRGKFGADVDAVALIKRAHEDLAAITDTPELAALRDEGSAQVKNIVKLHGDTMAALNEYADGWQHGRQNDFTALLDGVTIDQKFQEGGYKTTVTIE